MKILIPHHLNNIFNKRLKDISVNTDFDLLSVKRQRSFLIRGANYIGRRYLPYHFYDRIKRIRNNAETLFFVNGKIKKDVVSDAEVLITSLILDREMLSILVPRIPNLKWIHSITTGVDHIISCGANLNNIKITNIGNIYSKCVAEFALSVILTITKNIPEHLKLNQERKWVSLPSSKFKNTTVGIIGLGNIGTELVKLVSALKFRVIAVDPKADSNPIIDKLFKPQELSTFLSEADFVVLCCPLTKNTMYMLSEETLKCMRKDAYLINIARGGLIDENALIMALKEKRIKGACLDVFEDEPLPPNCPLYKLENIIITHHSAYYYNDAMSETIDTFIENYNNYIAKKPLLNQIIF